MNGIQADLRLVYPALRLSIRNVGEAYQLSDFIIGRQGNVLYITIKFPITPVEETYTLYEVRQFPLVMPDMSPHVTTLETDIAALAYSPAAQYYIQFRTMPQIHHHALYMPDVEDIFRHDASPTCIYALFKNMQTLIRQLCSFTLQPYSIVPSMYMLDESHILSTYVGNVTLQCPPHPRSNTISFSPQCIHKLPCDCSLSTADIYIPPHLTDCGAVDLMRLRAQNASWFPVTHVTNLPVLEHFFSDEDLGYLAADMLIDLPIQAILPNFTMFKNNYSTTLAAIDTTEFRLNKALNLTLTRKIAYRSMAEYIGHTHMTATVTLQDDIDSGWYHVYRSPLGLASAVLSLITFGFVLTLSFKIRALSMLLIGARSAAAAPTFLNFFTSSTTRHMTLATTTTAGLWMEEYLDLIMTGLGCLFAPILFIPVYHYFVWHYVSYKRTDRPYTEIFLQLITTSTQIYIPFLTLERYFEGYTFSAQGTLTSLKIVGNISPKLCMKWPSLIIKHEAVRDTVEWPKKIGLTYTQASTIRSAILQRTTPFHAILYAHSYGDTHASVTYLDHIKGEPALITAEPNAPEPDQPRLYPVV